MRHGRCISQQEPLPCTGLADTRGYLLATDGAFGTGLGIQAIAPEYVVRHFSFTDGEIARHGCEIQGINRILQPACGRSLLFSELGLPWAKPVNY